MYYRSRCVEAAAAVVEKNLHLLGKFTLGKKREYLVSK
jgi:hypothetical protein